MFIKVYCNLVSVLCISSARSPVSHIPSPVFSYFSYNTFGLLSLSNFARLVKPWPSGAKLVSGHLSQSALAQKSDWCYMYPPQRVGWGPAPSSEASSTAPCRDGAAGVACLERGLWAWRCPSCPASCCVLRSGCCLELFTAKFAMHTSPLQSPQVLYTPTLCKTHLCKWERGTPPPLTWEVFVLFASYHDSSHHTRHS